jgi:hypothetical protein
MRNVFMKLMLVGVILLSMSILAAAEEADTYVAGVLTDAAGGPAVGFVVSILGTSPSSTHNADATTDEHGKFRVNNLEFGSYLVAPHLDTLESHYPPGTSAFYNKHLERFTLSQESPQATLSLTLDPPCLILRGMVTDSVTGHPLVATINLSHTNDKDKWVRFGSAATGAYRTWIPRGQTLEMTVSAPGYEEFRTTIESIEDGEDPTLNISLAPAARSAPDS